MANPKILIISSKSPFEGPGVLSLDLRDALVNSGVECDLLLHYKEKSLPDVLYVEKQIEFRNPLLNKIYNYLRLRITVLYKILLNKYCNRHTPYFFFYKREKDVPVSVNKILNKINKPYDLVVVMFWQRMLTFKTIEAIYDKLHCQIHFSGVDFSHMSGGCHFTNDCENYKVGCGKCNAINSSNPNDFTHQNVLFRKNVYEKVKPVVFGNSYMISYYKKSYLLRDYDRLEVSYPLIDENIFCVMDKSKLREKYNIGDNIDYIIFFGSFEIADKRKGIPYLLDALKKFKNIVSENEIDNILLLVAGADITPIENEIVFNYKHVGLVPLNQLSELYNLADVFVCPSVIDAGPMMVNQAIMCGTPVVGFEMGALLDVVKDQGTGICTKLKDIDGLCRGINDIYSLKKDKPESYNKMKLRCREFGIEHFSKQAIVMNTLTTYFRYKL